MKIMRKPIQFICMASMVILLAGSVASCSCSSNKNTKPTTYVEAVAVNDYVTAHEILDRYLQNAIDENAKGGWSNDYYMEKFWAAADHIYKAEMMYLIEMNDAAANKRLINTLAMMNIIGDKPIANEHYWMHDKEYTYYLFVSRFNRLCDAIIDISILNNNREMARQVLTMYKEDVIPRQIKTKTNTYAFTFSFRSKDEATKKFNDAIKNGLLD